MIMATPEERLSQALGAGTDWLTRNPWAIALMIILAVVAVLGAIRGR